MPQNDTKLHKVTQNYTICVHALVAALAELAEATEMTMAMVKMSREMIPERHRGKRERWKRQRGNGQRREKTEGGYKEETKKKNKLLFCF